MRVKPITKAGPGGALHNAKMRHRALDRAKEMRHAAKANEPASKSAEFHKGGAIEGEKFFAAPHARRMAHLGWRVRHR